MDRPHVCQRCSGTFVLASSLRTHAAHVHGEGLQAFLADSGCHPSRGSGNHGDTVGGVKPDKIKREMCGTDCEADDAGFSASSVTDSQDQVVHVGISNGHCENVDGSHSGNHGDTACDIKPDMIKAEIPDYEVEGIQYTTLMTDKQAHDGSDLHGKQYSNSFGTHLDTVGNVKPDMEKIKVCDYEVDSIEYTLVTDKQAHVDDSMVDHKIVAETTPLALPSSQADVQPDKGAVTETSNQMYTCKASGKTFDTAHLGSNGRERSHTGDKAHACNDFGKGVNYPTSLKGHIKRIHTVCSVREKRFKWLSHLKRHKGIHAGDRPYACNVCEKSFNYLSDLTRHKRIHTGEKPYACNVCEKRFQRLSTLKPHKRIHTGDKPYACDICEKRYNYLSHLKRHKRIHTGEAICL